MPEHEVTAAGGRHATVMDAAASVVWSAEVRDRSERLIASARTMATHRGEMPPQAYILWAASFIEKTIDLIGVLYADLG